MFPGVFSAVLKIMRKSLNRNTLELKYFTIDKKVSDRETLNQTTLELTADDKIPT